MGEQELFDGLISTYRDLNLKVRPLPENRLTLGRSGETVRDVVRDLRNVELHFSQALKDRLTGMAMADVFGQRGKLPSEAPAAGDTTAEILSQFGTARESTLAMLRGLAPEVWDDRGQGPLTVRDAAEGLLTHDARQLERIVTLLGSPAA